MGLTCSWIAVRTSDKAALLSHLDLVETGASVTPGCGQSAIAVHQSPDGWTILFSEDFDWATSEQILDLSRFGMTVGVRQEDQVAMEASVHAADKGVTMWRVSHDNEAGQPLEISGKPPKQFAKIRRACEQKQADDEDVDWFAEIPIELARHVCGYRVDESDSDFAALEPRANAASVMPRRRQGTAKKQVKQERPAHLRDFGSSVIAVRTDAKEELFDHLRVIETDKPVWPRAGQSMMSFYETNNGWLVILSEDVFWGSTKRLLDLSRFGPAVRTSNGHGFRHLNKLLGAIDGQLAWSVQSSPKEFSDGDWPGYDSSLPGLPSPEIEKILGVKLTNGPGGRAARALWGFDIERPTAPFTALRRRWPWMRRRRPS